VDINTVRSKDIGEAEVSSYENIYELMSEGLKKWLYEIVMRTYRNGVEYGAWIYAYFFGNIPTAVTIGRIYEGTPKSVALDFNEIEEAPAIIGDFHTHPHHSADLPSVQDIKFSCYTAFYYDKRDVYYSMVIGMPLDERRAVITYYTVKPEYRKKMYLCSKVCSGVQDMIDTKYSEIDIQEYIINVVLPTAFTVVRAIYEDGKEVEVTKPKVIYAPREALYSLIGEGLQILTA